jgi:SWI/SNF-related matrix-associated actin-dependent regulator of chromatin subfamily A containing DEAD/H box 1
MIDPLDVVSLSDYALHKICENHKSLKSLVLAKTEFENCGKVLSLKSLLRKLNKQGHRVLLFSQMTKVLDILEKLMQWWGYGYKRLDGSTPVPNRQVSHLHFITSTLNLLTIINNHK